MRKENTIINIILWILSHSPILCLSDDDDFATLEWKNIKAKKVHLRISVFNLMFGDYILYIITFDVIQKKLKPMHVIRLENMDGILLTDEKIKNIQDRFKQHIRSLSNEDLEIEKEALCYHIENEENRINSSIDKLNIYASIILMVLPLVLTIIDLKKIICLSLPLLIGVILIIYSVLNICIYIFRTIKIRGIKKSSFSDLRSSLEKNKDIVLQYQYDWQQLKYKAQLFVSFLLNLQEWVVAILILSVFVSFGVSFENTNRENKVEVADYNIVTNVLLDKIDEPYTDSAVEWAELISNIEKKQCRKIIFILSEEEDVAFVHKLEKYNELDIKIVRDEALEKGHLKIIQESKDE